MEHTGELGAAAQVNNGDPPDCEVRVDAHSDVAGLQVTMAQAQLMQLPQSLQQHCPVLTQDYG